MMKHSKLAHVFLMVMVIALLSSCSLFKKREYSRTTGWEYNNPENGGFEVSDVNNPVLLQPGEFHIYTDSKLKLPDYLGINERKQKI